jgi:single-stranded-DNA-specific exonuclease
MLPKYWDIKKLKTPAPELLHHDMGVSPIMAQLLFNRGIERPEDAREFLYSKDVTYNPFDLEDMTKAVTRIWQAIDKREPIAVYGDFDADGVTSTALLVEALRKMGASVIPYIPHRIDEGYGLNSPALQKFAAKGVKLVVTVDCGIRSVEEVEDGKAAGLDIIITDHHSPGLDQPDAHAIINPKLGSYPEKGLAGVGVAFKLVQALIMERRRTQQRSNGRFHFEVRDLFDLVALGTVADIMPLNRIENRVLVRRGIEAIREARRPGLRALLEVAGVEPESVSATTLSFVLGPRINAAGRLGDARLALDLLLAEDKGKAKRLAEELHQLNTLRQEKTREAQETIQQELQTYDDDLPLIFASHASFEPGIVGLVAGRLAEEYFRPAVIMEEGETESRASCRSIPQFDITAALDECADLLVRHGGHALAAGFTVINDNIGELRERLTALARGRLSGQKLNPTLTIDMELDIHQLSEDLVQELEALEPCGHENSVPVFMVRNAHVAEFRTVGKDGNHLKLKISRASQPPLDAIGFGLGHWAANMPERIDLAFQLEINQWNGRRSLQANLQDIRPATHDESASVR